ncbi:hypothetical protein [Thermococcus sp.]|uniref:hypothetical protein n=1 Tax=Thermococcus sp. TaxID=35749 RepID=UPI00345B4629
MRSAGRPGRPFPLRTTATAPWIYCTKTSRSGPRRTPFFSGFMPMWSVGTT